MRRFLFLAGLPTFILTALLLLKIFSVSAAGSVIILSHSSFIDDLGFFHVVGEVENKKDMPISSIKIRATFYNVTGTYLCEKFTYSMIDVVLPGKKAPFEITLTDKDLSSKVDHYTLNITYIESLNGKPLGLRIVSNNTYIDSFNFLHVEGQIENVANTRATNVKIAVTFYDEFGKVAACGYVYADPKNIEPNQKASFDIVLTHRSLISRVKNYILTAESSEYALVPELIPESLIFFITIIVTITFAIKNCSVSRSNAELTKSLHLEVLFVSLNMHGIMFVSQSKFWKLYGIVPFLIGKYLQA